MATMVQEPITEEVVALAQHTHEMILAIKVDRTERAFRWGYLFKQMRDQQLYRALGHDSFTAYIATAELSMLRTNVYHFITLHETYEAWLKIEDVRVTLADIDPWKLSAIRPMLTEENWQDWVQCARSLSRKDLRRLIEETKARAGRKASPFTEDIEPDAAVSDEEVMYDRETARLSALLHGIVIDAERRPEGIVLKFDNGMMLRCFSPYGPDIRFEIVQRAEA